MKTKKGSELTLKNLKGKAYLEVNQRILWLRDDCPGWRIKTECLFADDSMARFYAGVFDDSGNLIATGHGSETMKDFRDFYEKAETKAVGRALAMAGFGTQFAVEMDEGERIADAPVQLPQKKTTAQDLHQSRLAEVKQWIAMGADRRELSEFFDLHSIPSTALDRATEGLWNTAKDIFYFPNKKEA